MALRFATNLFGENSMKNSIAAVSAVATLLFAGAANAGNMLGINYFRNCGTDHQRRFRAVLQLS